MQRIHVSVRVRPLSPEDAKSSPWRISDRIFEEECRTLEIYKAQAENIVSAAIQGFNVVRCFVVKKLRSNSVQFGRHMRSF
nr:kinesin-like protein KIN-7O isoform X2 [Nicotiana tomentosiformis]